MLVVIILALASLVMSSISDITMDFDLYPEEDLEGLCALRFNTELVSTEPLVLFRAASRRESIMVKSAQIRRAEGGAVINLYTFLDDHEPSVSISFAIDIHDSVDLSHFKHGYSKNNVKVFVASPSTINYKFEKVDITRPFPQLYILH